MPLTKPYIIGNIVSGANIVLENPFELDKQYQSIVHVFLYPTPSEVCIFR
jgi:hypothetical protein